MDALVKNTDCLTKLGVTVTQSKTADPTLDVSEEFIAAGPTNRAAYLCEKNDVAGFLYIN